MSYRDYPPDPIWLQHKYAKLAASMFPGHKAKRKDCWQFQCPECNVGATIKRSKPVFAAFFKGTDRKNFFFKCHEHQRDEGGLHLRQFLRQYCPSMYEDYQAEVRKDREPLMPSPSTAESTVKASNGRMRERFAKTGDEAMAKKTVEKMDDEDVATAFLDKHRERFRYDPSWTKSRDEKGMWLFFNGSTWSPDSGNTVGETVGTIVRKDAKVGSAIRRLKTKSVIQRTAWDVRPDLIAFPNGVYDLTADEFRKGRHDDYLTKACSVAYNPSAKAPRWERFLAEVFDPTPDVVPFLQELLGYMFTGYTDPHHVTFFYGAGGRNGKSTLCKILQRLCPDYTWTFNAQRIFGHKTPDIPNDIADFKGYRFVYSNELPKQVKLTGTLVKLLSGGDEIVARQLFAANQNISPTWHMVIVSNHAPTFDDDGDALWDRVLCVPFKVRFEGAKQDRTLDETLLKEGEGILAWIVEGARRYIKNGRQFTKIPDAVRAAGEHMRELARSPVDAFISERLEKDSGAATAAKDIWEAYQEWCGENDVPILERLTLTKLGRELSEKFRKGSDSRTRTVIYIGVRLKGTPKPSAQHQKMVNRLP
jgi:P4 family phage/plasmid primase-like protien